MQTDMDSQEMQTDAVAQASVALSKYETEKDVSRHIKSFFDAKYSPNWHCVVGKNFASYATHESKTYIFFYLGQVAVLLYKA
ncbi:unnamed protein product [Vitrella brassicaformis CCMP3155]|uniref:Dynein light chain n=1 Tax=Vitrella brassicaformis (strain CCMP3155) TaxID=1169540 RepID=A0A0G4G7N8_VITBC|nr:unnamed protein product [Vitrella brassicaformis CCMP3155]|eukprot:CEM24661.1 unnamed protein product [Vitrella brassicaformis CCMP3155]